MEIKPSADFASCIQRRSNLYEQDIYRIGLGPSFTLHVCPHCRLKFLLVAARLFVR